ncbi:hypothetical protein V1506DRAFT_510398 [Lipomyces tetrasporus]
MEAMEEKQERREERNERRQMQREQRQFSLQNQMYPGYIMQPQFPLHSPGQTPHAKPYDSTSTYPERSSAAGPQNTAGQQRYSSPINVDEEDADILALFFNWKIGNTRNPDRRTKWEHARDVVSRNDWSIRELLYMEDGLARGFRAETHLFKVLSSA